MKGLAIILLVGIAATVVINACSQTVKVDTIAERLGYGKGVEELVVENTISMDRQYMFMNYGNDYRWFETCIVLGSYLDEECDGSIVAVSNVFQYVKEREKSADVYVVISSHTLEGSSIEVKHDFWIEDYPMNDDAVKVSFMQAYENIMACNCPKPHSKNVVLRKMVGPVAANPQWIFGNLRHQVYVDAVTGEVSTKNPSFPEGYVGGPLGEWP